MNKYMHAVGLCIGLTAVIILSAVDGLSIAESEWLTTLAKPALGRKAYSFGWLVSYVLTALVVGEFAVVKKMRKALFAPLAFMIFTALSFFAFFRLESPVLSAVFLALATAVQAVILLITAKRTRLCWIGALVNLLWYCFMLGMNIIVLAINR